MKKPERKLIAAKNLFVDLKLNPRNERRYRLDEMCEAICISGRINDAVVCETTADPKVYRVLKGNRRTWGAQLLVQEPQRIINILLALADSETDPLKGRLIRENLEAKKDEILENLGKIECLVHSDLTHMERERLVLDHGQVLGLGRSEFVEVVWRMAKNGMSEAEIIRDLYFSAADYTGNKKKRAEVEAITDVKLKEKAKQTWLHGTIGNQIMKAQVLGPIVRQQFMLTKLKEDQLLKEGEKVEIEMKGTRIVALSAAQQEDLKGAGWDPDKGGIKFNALLEQYRKEDSGEIQAEAPRPTATAMRDNAARFNTPAIRKAFLYAAGEKGKDVEGLAEDDERMYRDMKVLAVVGKEWENLPKDLQDFTRHLLGDNPPDFEKYVAGLKAADPKSNVT